MNFLFHFMIFYLLLIFLFKMDAKVSIKKVSQKQLIKKMLKFDKILEF